MSLKQISISARLILVMSLIAILTAGLSAYLILRFIDSGKQVKVLAEEGTRGIIWGEKANFYLHNLIINFYRANSGDMKWVTAMEENIPNIRGALVEYAKTAQDPENKRLLAETNEALDIYAADIASLALAFRQGIYGSGIIEILNKLDTKSHANRLITDITNLVEYSKAMAEKNRASFFADMDANTKASIALACVVIFILICAGYTGVIWTRDEIAEHNAKEQILKKLQADLLNSLDAAGAVSRQISFDTGDMAFVGEVDKVLGLPQQAISSFVSYVGKIHPEDRALLLGEIAWEDLRSWDDYVRLFPEDFIEVDGQRIMKINSEFVHRWVKLSGSETATSIREFRCPAPASDERKWRWKRSLSRLLPHPSGRGYMGESGILFDITSEYEIKNELIRAKYDAEAASRAKSDFLARMSHEIRTPMNAIIGMTHLLLRTRLTNSQQDYLVKIRTSAQVLLGIIRDILDFSKIEANRMELEELPFRLDDVFKSLADVIMVKALEKGLEVIFSIAENIPQHMRGDALRLSQVLINLANNAVKFTNEGEILVNVQLTERTESEALLHFSVTDTGIGLTEDQLKLLFQPFTQADGSITRRFGGTGLGLAISKSLVEAMGGRIWAESQPDKGSTFHFTVRLPISADQGMPMEFSCDLSHLRTLVLDDNDLARENLQNMLGTMFSQPPRAASSLDEALILLQSPELHGIPCEIIFVDYQLRGTEELEAVRSIKRLLEQTGSHASIVLMANSADLETIRPAAQLIGVSTFLLKPVCPSDLFDTVAKLCGCATNKENATHIMVSQEMLEQVQGTRILLVEDNLFNQQVARELLEQAGMVVEVAANGFAALEMVEHNSYDLAFMDIQMPDLDGLDVTRRIRSKLTSTELPIIALTAHALSSDREKSLEAGMNDHLTKPIDPEELLAILVKWGNPARKHAAHKENPDLALTAYAPASVPEQFHFVAIDHQTGLKHSMNNRATYLRLLKLFYQEYSCFGELCQSTLTRNDHTRLGRLAHAIKGPAGSIGALDLQRAAHDLEQAMLAQDLGRSGALVSSVQHLLDIVLQDLAPVVQQENMIYASVHSATWTKDTTKAKSLLLRLRSHLEINDPEAATIMKELDLHATLPPDLAQQLQSQIDSFDFDDALDTLGALEKRL